MHLLSTSSLWALYTHFLPHCLLSITPQNYLAFLFVFLPFKLTCSPLTAFSPTSLYLLRKINVWTCHLFESNTSRSPVAQSLFNVGLSQCIIRAGCCLENSVTNRVYWLCLLHVTGPFHTMCRHNLSNKASISSRRESTWQRISSKDSLHSDWKSYLKTTIVCWFWVITMIHFNLSSQ